jgi:photosystem II stability/assembly factor-like uncharacterized protein
MKNLLIIALTTFLVFQNLRLHAQWIQTNSKFGKGSGVTSMIIIDKNLFVGVSGSGIYLSTDNGINWIKKNNGLTNLDVSKIVVKGTNIFAATINGIFISTDYGNLWTPINNGLPETWIPIGIKHIDVRTLLVCEQNIFAGTMGGVYVSSDDGLSWIARNDGLSNLSVFALAIKDEYLYAGTYWEVHPMQGGQVFSSSDYGANWKLSSNGLPDKIILDLAVSEKNLFVAINDYWGIFRTSDGENWNTANNRLPPRLPRCLISLKRENVYYLFVGNLNYPTQDADAQAVWFSTNEGQYWTSFSQGLGNSTVWSLASNDQYIFAGVDSVVWRRPFNEILNYTDVAFTESPKQFILEQNYPNPFNPSTKIKYTIPTPPSSSPLIKGRKEVEFVTLKVYDILGRDVATLVNEEKHSGNYEVKFDGSNLPSGIYFYKLEAGGNILSKKLILLK